MKAGNDYNAAPQTKSKKTILRSVLAIVVILILLVVFLLPSLVSSEKGHLLILARINSSINGKLDFRTLSMSWLKGLKVTELRFNDDTGQCQVKVRQIITKPHYSSLLLGTLSFGPTIIDEPRVDIILKDQQTKHAKRQLRYVSAGAQSEPGALPIKRIDLVINDGNLKVTDTKKETVEFSDINSTLNLRPPGRQTKFDVDMTVADKTKESNVSAKGEVSFKRKKAWSFKGTSGGLSVEVNDLDLGSLGPIFELAGANIQAKGIISADIKSQIKDGRLEKLSGNVSGKNIDITGPALKGDRLKTSTLDVGTKLQRKKELINIEKLDIKTDWLRAQAHGEVPTTVKALTRFLKSDSPYSLKGSFDCDLAAVLSLMPRTFAIKEGMKITSGQLSGDIDTSTLNGRRQISGQANLTGLSGIVEGRKIVLSQPIKAVTKITSDKAGIKFDQLDVSASFANINLSGRIEALKYTAVIDLAKLQTELGQFVYTGPYRIAGQLQSAGEISSKEDRIAAAGSSSVENLRLSSKEGLTASEPKADINFSATIIQDKDVLDIDFIKADASLGQVNIKDSLLPLSKKAAKPAKITVSANNIDLGKLRPFGVLLGAFPKEMQLAGMAESKMSVNSKNGIYTIATDATKIKNLRLLSPGQQPFEQKEVLFVFDGDYDPKESNWKVRKVQLISPDIKIEGDFEKNTKNNTTRLQGRADYEYDWSSVSSVAAPYLPAGLKLEGKRKDIIRFTSEYPVGQSDELLANFNTTAKLGFERAEYMGLNIGQTEVDVQIQKGLLTIAPFSAPVNKGQLNFAAEADFRQKPTLLRIPQAMQIAKDIEINDKTTRTLLMYLNPIFANAVNVSGTANFNCEKLAIPLAGATRNDTEVIGTISIDKMRLQASDLLGQILSVSGSSTRGQDITIHPTRFVLQNGFLRYDNMQMDIGDNPINFQGVIGLDKSLDMRVTLPYTLKGETVRTGRQTSGQRVTLSLKGTTDRPELDVGKLFEDQLRQRAIEALEELLK